jgi:hypothetical protein
LGEARKSHLWVVATEPNQEGHVCTVSFTSLRGAKDQTVILLKHEHTFVKWDTSIAYALAEITTCDAIQDRLDCGLAKIHTDLDAAIVKLILDGFIASDFTKNRIRDFVKAYRNQQAVAAAERR